MRNIFLFINRHSNFLLFLALQFFCIYLIVHYNKYHNAVFSNTANQVTGKINSQYNKVENYFTLKKTNDSLVKVNERLYNLLKQNYQLPDTVVKTVVDSIRVDSIIKYQRYNYLQAEVVSNSIASQTNYIVINRGSKQNVKLEMGVIDAANGVVGKVVDVSDDFSVIMSMLHRKSQLSGKLFKGGEIGTVIWDGKQPNQFQLEGIPKSAKVAKGDSIITSGYSTSFPKGLIMGIVTDVQAEKSSNNYLIKFQSATNFYNIQYVYIIENAQQNTINNLLKKQEQKPVK